jgi:FRG domain
MIPSTVNAAMAADQGLGRARLPIELLSNIEIVRVRTVEEAVARARLADADRFRGQVYPWPPRSSLDRWKDANSWSALAQLELFHTWIAQQPVLQNLAKSEDEAVAIAQHFGVPTYFVDFSTSVEIAALFARDRPSEVSFPGPEACIYWYNSEELFAWFRRISRDERVRLQLYPFETTIPQLHRLSAQHGVFMHAPAEWYESVPLHCILFDRGPPLDEMERSHLYPPTGRLEEQIRAFLHQAAHEMWFHETSKLPNFRHVTLRPPPPDEMRECFASLTPQGNPPRIEDWPVAESGWTADSYRPHRPPLRIQFAEQPEKFGIRMLAECLIGQLSIAIHEDASIAEEPMEFSLPASFYPDDAAPIEGRMARAWNAMADYPYTIKERLHCLEVLLIRGTSGIGLWRSDSYERLQTLRIIERPQLVSDPDLDRWCRISLSERHGPPTSSLACLGELKDAFHPGLETRLSETGKALLARNPLELMRRVRDPAFLFAFEELRRCFVEYLIPMQLIRRDDDAPMICSPAKLDYLGPP